MFFSPELAQCIFPVKKKKKLIKSAPILFRVFYFQLLDANTSPMLDNASYIISEKSKKITAFQIKLVNTNHLTSCLNAS